MATPPKRKASSGRKSTGMNRDDLKRKAVLVFRGVVVCLVLLAGLYALGNTKLFSQVYNSNNSVAGLSTTSPAIPVVAPVLNTVLYDEKMIQLANYPTSTIKTVSTSTRPVATSSKAVATSSVPTVHHLWPVKTAYPNVGALLPFNRIVAYYGNFYSKGMGVLGQYPEPQMIGMLNAEVSKWQLADPSTPVIPAIDYIAVTAQGSAGADGKYRLRMPDSQIDHALELAKEVNGIVILDVQVGLSTLQTELPLLEKYLKMSNVHLAIDPEFSMKDGVRPGREIGTFDSADINYAANYLAGLVRQNGLTPKILVIHRFTEDMVTGYKKIAPLPEVQIVMDMDGWGFPAKKINTYNSVIYPEPVQFTGFKLFYKNDILPPSTRMLTPAEILKLKPRPSFIQYQ